MLAMSAETGGGLCSLSPSSAELDAEGISKEKLDRSVAYDKLKKWARMVQIECT